MQNAPPSTSASNSLPPSTPPSNVISNTTEGGPHPTQPPSPGVGDSAAPTIVSVSVSPQVVTVGGTVFTSFQLADVGGLSFVALFWQNSFRGQVNSCPNGGGLSRSSGDAFNATYQSSCTLPSFGIPSGLYSIHIRADDTAGNSISTVLGSFNVTGGVDDFAAPDSKPSSPAGGHDVVLVLFSDYNCTLMPNSSDVAVNLIVC